ncbi:hypothetical protein N9J91_02240 [Gammaproteobacteria bacterium]|nr:hypothetical protein [Gammaproteobacteria bacterium]
MLKNLIKAGSTYLDTMSVLSLNGSMDKIEALLQGQVTSDITQLANGCAQISCLLDEKGFIQADFIIIRKNDEIFFVIEETLVANLNKQLGQFTKFYSVEITEVPLQVQGILSEIDANKKNGMIYFNNDKYQLAIDLSTSKKDIIKQMTLLEWRIANKVLLNYEFSQDDINKYRPNELNYDKTRVSFTKGCFRGQEIVARVHYLGVNRREFVTAIVDINSQDNSKLKVKGKILEHLDYKIFNASIKKDDVEKGIFNSLDLIRS